MLRHTFATLAAYFGSSQPLLQRVRAHSICRSCPRVCFLFAGVPLPTAQAILRHSNVLMLVRVYAKAGRLHSNEGLSQFPI